MTAADGPVSQLARFRRGGLLATCAACAGALAVLLVYWPALGNGFIWDDFSYLVHSSNRHDAAQWKDAIFHPRTGETVFRPLTLLTFAAQLWAGQTDPQPYHAANLFIHALNVFLVALLAWRLTGRNSPPVVQAASVLLCGLVYGLHPALSEAVLWIAGRFDLLMTSFLLFAMLLDSAWPATDWKRALGVSSLFLAAMLCKETAVGFLVALPILHLAVERTPLQRAAAACVVASRLRLYAGLLIAFAVYLLFRFAVLGASFGMDLVVARHESIGSMDQLVLVTAASLARYVSDVIWIAAELTPNRVMPLPVESLTAVLSVAAILGVVALAGIAIRFTSAGRFPAWCAIAFLASLVPVSNIVPAPTHPGELQIASRYLTFPLVFACLAACALPAALNAWRPASLKLFGVAVAAWVITSAGIVRMTIPLWKDEGTFFRWAIARSGPTTWRYLYINLGAHYLGTGELARARDAFAQATEFPPLSNALASITWYNLGNAELKLGNAAQAVRAFNIALSLNASNIYARAALADHERVQGRASHAAELLEDGLARLRAAGRPRPDQGLLHYRLGQAYADLGRRDDAVKELMLARRLVSDPFTRAAVDEALRAIPDAPPSAR